MWRKLTDGLSPGLSGKYLTMLHRSQKPSPGNTSELRQQNQPRERSEPSMPIEDEWVRRILGLAGCGRTGSFRIPWLMGTMVRTSIPRGLERAGGWALPGDRRRRSSVEQHVCIHPWVSAHRPVFLCVACSIYQTTVPTEGRLKQALPSRLPVLPWLCLEVPSQAQWEQRGQP